MATRAPPRNTATEAAFDQPRPTARGLGEAIAGYAAPTMAHKRRTERPTKSATPEHGHPGAALAIAALDTNGHVAMDRVADRFGMSKLQLAETIGLARETIYRPARMQAPKTQARATEMLEIVGRIAGWAGGEKQAMAWYRAEPIAAFGGRTAECLVKEGKAAAVRDFLDHVATGGFA